MIAGETSGDMLGVALMQAIRRLWPQAQFEGIGGPRMLAEGFHSFFPMERLSVMGFIEPLGRLPELLHIKKALVHHFQKSPPDVFIGIDSPGFNLRIEQELHDLGIRTVHYVSPSVWAWGQKRIHKIARAVDLVLALFPFETAIYEQHRVPVRFVGHPLADTLGLDAGDAQHRQRAREALGLQTGARVIALLPGSRRDEIRRLGAVFIATALRCLRQDQALCFVIPCANAERRAQVLALLQAQGAGPEFMVFEGNSQQAMQAADLVLLASGTATLEAMLLRRPMVVCYRLAPLTWMLASRMLKVPYVSLPNLLAAQRLVPEFLQEEVTPETLCAALQEWLDNPARQATLVECFAQIHDSIRRDASRQAAEAIVSLVEARTQDER
jgi:lipid-A-disaccharide synthase